MDNQTPYSYVFVRHDLSAAQQIVQASHAAQEAGFKYDRPEGPVHLVLFDIPDEEALLKVSEYIGVRGIDHVMFYETDIEAYTALATKPIYGKDRNVLSKYELYCPEFAIKVDMNAN